MSFLNVFFFFKALDAKFIDEYMKKELWIKSNFIKWKEAKDIEEKERLAASAKHRQYRRYMKKNAGNTISFLDD